MSSEDKRTQLLRVGIETFTERGFFNTSVNDIVSAANVPKGSFAYYFGHKDKYMLDVIRSYGEYFNKKLDKHLLDKSIPPLDRIESFIDEAINGMQRFAYKRGCLVGNLGQELAALDENSRSVLLETLRSWQDRIRICLVEAKDDGTLAKDVDTDSLARLFWYSWEGAVLCSKLERSREPLDLVGGEFMSKLRRLSQS